MKKQTINTVFEWLFVVTLFLTLYAALQLGL